MIFFPGVPPIADFLRERADKPRIARYAKRWYCGVGLAVHQFYIRAQSPIGWGETPTLAYRDWKGKS